MGVTMMIIRKKQEKNQQPLEKLKDAVGLAKQISVLAMSIIIIVGILSIFVCSIVGKRIPGLSEMSLFVSIVLGIVATIVSIVSMLISFYGIEKTEESERRQHIDLEKIIDIANENKRMTQSIDKRVETVQTALNDRNRIVDIKYNTENENIPADAD